MPNVFYLIKRIVSLDYSNMFKAVKEINRKTGRNQMVLFTDMVKCGLKYGAGYVDYKLFRFYELNDSQRATFITRAKSNQIVNIMNNNNYAHIMANKTEFNTYFSHFIGRGWIDMENIDEKEFQKFAETYPVIISKPNAANCGQGIEKFTVSKYSSVADLYNHLKNNGTGIVEEFVSQHHDMALLYPNALNTIRVVTILDDVGKAVILKTMLRVGSGNSIVDNLNAGGMTTLVDPTTGIVQNPATNKNGDSFPAHPDTKIQFAGFEIPFWEDSLQICRQAAESIPQLRYIGWDIAITAKGPILIEGNHIPGHDIIQMPDHLEKEKTGMLPTYRKYIKGI